MKRIGGWMGGLLGAAATTGAAAEATLPPMAEPFGLADRPGGSALALVGMGLLVLSVFARRRRDP